MAEWQPDPEVASLRHRFADLAAERAALEARLEELLTPPQPAHIHSEFVTYGSAGQRRHAGFPCGGLFLPAAWLAGREAATLSVKPPAGAPRTIPSLKSAMSRIDCGQSRDECHKLRLGSRQRRKQCLSLTERS